MSDRTPDHYRELLRRDFVSFAHRAHLELSPAKPFESNWHIEAIAEKLEAVRAGQIKRLIVNAPPRSLKSFLGSIYFPAFVLGHTPDAEILCTSYGQEFANSLALPCRNLIGSSFYKSLFETRLAEERQAVEEFKTTAGGVRRAVSLSGALMGRGADYIIIDDPLKVEEANSQQRRAAVNEAYHTAVATRLNRDTGAIVLIMQRLHHNDLSAFVQRTEHWEILRLPALAEQEEHYRVRNIFGWSSIIRQPGESIQPQRQSAEYLAGLKIQKGSPAFDAQYQQRPHGAESAVLAREWLSFYDERTLPNDFQFRVQSWDTAAKGGETNSYSVCTTWGIQSGKYYLLDRYRSRPDFRELKERAVALAREFRPTAILIEEQSLGPALRQELSARQLPVETVPPSADSKLARLFKCINKFERGSIILPAAAPWLEEYVDELTTFPDSDFDDQIDSTTQALNWDMAERSAGFENFMEYMRRISDGAVPARNEEKTKLKVLRGGGQIIFGDGRPTFNVPVAGEIIEVAQSDLGVFLGVFGGFEIYNG